MEEFQRLLTASTGKARLLRGVLVWESVGNAWRLMVATSDTAHEWFASVRRIKSACRELRDEGVHIYVRQL